MRKDTLNKCPLKLQMCVTPGEIFTKLTFFNQNTHKLCLNNVLKKNNECVTLGNSKFRPICIFVVSQLQFSTFQTEYL